MPLLEKLPVTMTFERMTQNSHSAYLTIFGLTVTLTFDLLTSVRLCPQLHLNYEFGEIPTSSL